MRLLLLVPLIVTPLSGQTLHNIDVSILEQIRFTAREDVYAPDSVFQALFLPLMDRQNILRVECVAYQDPSAHNNDTLRWGFYLFTMFTPPVRSVGELSRVDSSMVRVSGQPLLSIPTWYVEMGTDIKAFQFVPADWWSWLVAVGNGKTMRFFLPERGGGRHIVTFDFKTPVVDSTMSNIITRCVRAFGRK